MAAGGIVTILFTDLVSSTRLLAELGEEGAESLRREHLRLLREALEARAGEEVKNVGDGLMVVFGSVVEAFGAERGHAVAEIWGSVYTAIADALLGNTEASRESLARAQELIGDEDVRGMQAEILFADALTAAASGRLDDATALFERSLDLAGTYQLRWLEADILHRWGAFTRDTDKLGAAIDVYREIDAAPFWSERVRADMPA